MGLKAQVSGGYVVINTQPVVKRYTFSVDSPVSSVIKQDTTDATVWWLPKVPGYYSFRVNVKQTLGSTVVAEATATTPGLCEVKKVTYQVTLNVSPPSGQAEAPPQTVAKRLTLSASVSNPFGNPNNEFRFTVSKMGGGGTVALNTVRTIRSYATWTPDPPQPADPGIYVLAVQVVDLQTSPQGDVVVAEGSNQIIYYEAKPARPFANVIVHTGDVTMVRPSPASQVSLTVNPLSPSPSTGDITMNATVSVPGNPSGVTNKFTFSYVPSAGGQPVSQVLTPSGASQSWILSPQPAPGTYTLVANVETRRTTDNTPLAQGSAQIANYVVAGPTYPFGWIFPVTTQNTTLAVGTPYGSATNSIAGNSINAIANSQQVRVRADNTACASCHGGSFSQSDFCVKGANYLTDVKAPHAGSVQPADQTLSSLFKNWTARNCPQ